MLPWRRRCPPASKAPGARWRSRRRPARCAAATPTTAAGSCGSRSTAPRICASSSPTPRREVPGFFAGVEPYPHQLFMADLLRVTDGRTDPELAELLIGRSYDTACWMARQGIEMEPAVSLSAVKVGDTIKWSPGAVIRAKHEGVGLSAMWFRAAERPGVEIRYDTAVVRLAPGPERARDGRGGARAGGLRGAVGQGGGARLRRLRGESGVARALPRPALGSRQGARHALQHRRRPAHGDGAGRAAARPVDRLPLARRSTPTRRRTATAKLTDKTNRLSYPLRRARQRARRALLRRGRGLPVLHLRQAGRHHPRTSPAASAWQIFDCARCTHLLEGRYKTGDAAHGRLARRARRASSPLDRARLPANARGLQRRGHRRAASIPTVRDGLATRGLRLAKSQLGAARSTRRPSWRTR